jgi:4-amino-4-deoxy-L-arabinose transferase-like glycosyltransferase
MTKALLTVWLILAVAAAVALFLDPGLFHLSETITIAGVALAIIWLSITLAGSVAIARKKQLLVYFAFFPVALRLLTYLYFATHPVPGFDAAKYELMARNILDHHSFVTPPFQALYAPLYSTALAGFSIFTGVNEATVLLLNTSIDLLLAFTIYVIADELQDPRTGAVAAWLYLMWPAAVLSAGVAQKDTLAVLLVMQGIVALIRLRRAISAKELIRLGLTGGGTPLTQPPLLFVLPVLGLLLLAPKGYRVVLRVGSIAGAIALALCLPWWVRNYLLFGTFVPFTSASGCSTLVAVTGNLDVWGNLHRLGELKAGQACQGEAMQIIAHNPLVALYKRFSAYSQALTLDIWAPLRMRWAGLTSRETAGLIPSCELFYLAVLAGAAASSRSLRLIRPILLATLAVVLLSHLAFEFYERHRYVVMPMLMLLCASSLSGLASRQRRGWLPAESFHSVAPDAHVDLFSPEPLQGAGD